MEELLYRITKNPTLCGGRPCIRGMRIRVMSKQLFWIDAQLSPAFAHWLSKQFSERYSLS